MKLCHGEYYLREKCSLKKNYYYNKNSAINTHLILKKGFDVAGNSTLRWYVLHKSIIVPLFLDRKSVV